MNSYWLVHTGSENHCETTKSLKICYLFNTNLLESIISRSWMSTNWSDTLTASGPVWVTRLLNMPLVSVISVYVLAFVLKVDTLITQCNKDDMIWHVWRFWKTLRQYLPVTFVAILLIIPMYTLSLHRRLNLTLHISQRSASTYFRWSWHFRVSFVKGLFQDNPSNFYWNRFIFDRQRAKYKLEQFFWDTVYMYFNYW